MQAAFKRKIEDILPVIRWETIAPPYLEYSYFQGNELYPFRHDARIFDVVNAWWLIEASTLAYAEEEFAGEKFVQAGLTEVAFFSRSGTQCYVASNDRCVIVVFRGTEIRKDFKNIVADIATDLDVLMTPWQRRGKVHRGFKRALDQVWQDKLFPYIRCRDNGDRTIWFTGHSLGAALATLAADRYGNARGLYTFGSPRVGDEHFKRGFHVNAYRIVNNNDIVARLPGKTPYCHVGDLKFIDGEGIFPADPLIRTLSTEKADPPDRMQPRFAALIPDCIIDHVPILYATHIWNNIP